MQPIFLSPVFKQTLWGGSRLRQDFGYDTPGDNTGECWAISSHPNGDCTVASGPYAGMTLSALWSEHRELFGDLPGEQYPLLVKLIDAKEDLSVQVHPDDAYAKEHENGASGKTEFWYILDCPDNAEIALGHLANDHQEVEDMIRSGRWQEFIRRIPIEKGGFFQIEPGCVHSIMAGTLLIETQQNSDITYRVYDYDRLYDGKPRELHVEKSIDVIKAPYVPAQFMSYLTKGRDYELLSLISCAAYTVRKLVLHGEAIFAQDEPFLNVSVIDGKGAINGISVRKGDHFILPAGYGEYVVNGEMTWITSSVPAAK